MAIIPNQQPYLSPQEELVLEVMCLLDDALTDDDEISTISLAEEIVGTIVDQLADAD